MNEQMAAPFRGFVDTLRRSPLVRRTAVAGLLALSLGRIVSYPVLFRAPFATDNDFAPDYVSAKEWTHGGDPYDPTVGLLKKYLSKNDPAVHAWSGEQRNAHPPIFIVLHAPFTLLGPEAAHAVWIVLEAGALFLAVFLFVRSRKRSVWPATMLGLVAVALPVSGEDFGWAQVNGLFLLAFVLAWRDLQGGNEARGGAILGFVTALKLFPWLMLIPLIRARRTRAVKWFVGSTALFSIAGALATGFHPATEYLSTVGKINLRIWAPAGTNISLVSSLIRWLVSWTGDPVTIPVAGIVFGAAAFALCIWGAARTKASISGDPFWATVPWMILASPLAWPHYLVLVLPLLLLCMEWVGPARGTLRALTYGFVIVMMLETPLFSWLSTLTRSGSVPLAVDLAAFSALTALLLGAAMVEVVVPRQKARIPEVGAAAMPARR